MSLPDRTADPESSRPPDPAADRAAGRDGAGSGPEDERARFPLSALLLALAGLCAGYVLSIVGVAIGDAISRSERAWALLFGQFGLWAGMVGACLIASRAHGSGDPRRDFGLRPRRTDPVWGIGGGVADWVGSTAVAALVAGFVGKAYRGSNSDIVTNYHHDTAAIALVVAFAVVGAPIVEELFFRGLVQRALEPALGMVLALVVQALLFGGVHVTEEHGASQLGLWLSLSAVGLVHGVVYAKTRRLTAAMWTHALFNASSVVLILTTLQ